MQRTPRSDSPHVGRWTLAAAGALVLAAGLVLRDGATAATNMAPVAPESAAGHSSEPIREQLSVSREALQAAASPTYLDPLETLSSFWGERWPEVSAQLFPDGLEGQVLGPIQPWEQVSEMHFAVLAPDKDSRLEGLYRKLMSWPEWEYYVDHPVRVMPAYAELTPQSLGLFLRLPELSELSQEQVDGLEDEFRVMNSELDGLVRAFIDGAGAAVRFEFNKGDFERAPLGFPDEGAERDDDLYSREVAAGGWVTRIRILGESYPTLERLKDEIESLRERRRAAVREAAARLKPSPPT